VPLAACDAESQRYLIGLGGFFRGLEEQKERAVERTETVSSWPRLKARVERAGVTQTELAQAAGMTQGNISEILNGRAYVGPERMARLMKALRERGVDV
jgi:DNA-binding XRE family transcriptional regulator